LCRFARLAAYGEAAKNLTVPVGLSHPFLLNRQNSVAPRITINVSATA
jgi:hypothetical protein